MSSPEVDPIAGWNALLRRNWEDLARTRYRDYFIASHRGWDSPATWAAQASWDAEVVLHEIEPPVLAGLDVLELGCGVGRLAQVVAPRVRSYTGFDIAPSMVAEARRRCVGLPNVRFFVGEGDRVPDAARDRRYGLAFALAVLVHCPRDLIGVLAADVCGQLLPGGEFRCQLRADERDAKGIAPMSEAPIQARPPAMPEEPLGPAVVEDLRRVEAILSDRYYMGHAFGYDEAVGFLRAKVTGAKIRPLRFDPAHIYVDIRMP